MSFENLFSQRPPMAEAARFFLKLKTAADEGLSMPGGGPDEMGAQEGIFAAPLEQVIQLMAQMVQNEFKTMYAYTVYAQSLRGPDHFAISREFEEHAENELEHAEFLLRRMAVLSGGPITLPNVPPPPPLADPVEIIQAMIEMEQQGIANWRTLLTTLGDNPTKHVVENFLTRELEHLDELWQMLPVELQEGQTATAGSPAPTSTTAQPTQGAAQNPANSQAPAAGGASPMNDVGPKFAAVPLRSKEVQEFLSAHGGQYSDEDAAAFNEMHRKAGRNTWIGAGLGGLAGGLAGAAAGGHPAGALVMGPMGAAAGAGIGRLLSKNPEIPVTFSQQEAAKLGEKLASSHIQIRKEKAWGDPHKGGAAEIMDDFIKRAAVNPTFSKLLQMPTHGEVPLKQGVGNAIKHYGRGGLIGAAAGGGMGALSEPPEGGTATGNAIKGAIGGGVLGLGAGHITKVVEKENQAILRRRPDLRKLYGEKSASVEDPITKAREKAQASVAARNVHTQGQRGELYGDLVGRVLGAGGGWKAGKTLGGGRGAPLATVAAAGLGSMLGGHLGHQAGREMDAAKHAGLFQLLKKIAFDDRLNMLPQEQAAEQAQMQNESQFYSQKAQEHAAARQQLEASLQEATEKATQQEQDISQMQQTMQANSQAASSATTQALLQAVNANTESIKQRQLAASTTQGLATLKDQLRQLAGDPGVPDTSGGSPGGAPAGAAAGQPSDGNPQGQGNPAGGMFGAAGASPETQESASTVAPGGEQAGAAPTASNEGSPNNMPSSQGGMIGMPQGKMGSAELIRLAASWGEKVASLGSQLKAVGKQFAPNAAGAAVGGLATGGAALVKAQHSPEVEAERAQALDAENKPGYMGAMGRAKAHSAHAFQEVLHEHPVAGAMAAAVPGALMGGRMLPGAARAVKKTISNVKELGKVEG